MRHRDQDRGPIAADPIELLEDAEIDIGLGAEVFQHVKQQNLVDGIVRPWPRKLFQIKDLIHGGRGEFVDIDPAVHMFVAATEVQAHEVSLGSPRPGLRQPGMMTLHATIDSAAADSRQSPVAALRSSVGEVSTRQVRRRRRGIKKPNGVTEPPRHYPWIVDNFPCAGNSLRERRARRVGAAKSKMHARSGRII